MGVMDDLISPEVVARLSGAVEAIMPAVALPTLTATTRAVVGARLRDRVSFVRDALLQDLPTGFPAAEHVVIDLLEEPQFEGWMIWPVTEFVTARALESGSVADFDSAMRLLTRLTVGLTGEFAVRDLLMARPERALAIMSSWTTDENEHVRRLATEGSRTYLPWARRVPWLLAHPRATRAILDASYRDSSEYVRRSTANHLNDLSRVDVPVVLDIAAGWAADPDPRTPRVLKHGLRTLIRSANPTALALVGFGGGRLTVGPPLLSQDVVPWDGVLEFSAEVVNEGVTDAIVVIDYSIGFRRANGTMRSKTFRLATRRISAGSHVTVAKTHSFRPLTTRAYYPGAHSVVVQANGVLSPQTNFTLRAEEPGGRLV
jgi:3-methyladenine DNA glycosylase AlkC